MTPDDYQFMNDTLIIQAGENEITLQQQAERIRDLEAEIRDLRAVIADKDDKIAELMRVAPYQRK